MTLPRLLALPLTSAILCCALSSSAGAQTSLQTGKSDTVISPILDTEVSSKRSQTEMDSLSVFAVDKKATSASLLKFETLFIRFMSKKERMELAGDNLDPDMLLKYRIYNASNQTIYFYTNFAELKIPAGNMVKETKVGFVWLIDSAPTESTKSPGLRYYETGDWIPLSAGSTFEWEGLEISRPNVERHAITLFIKTSETGTPTEFFSDFYSVPAKKIKASYTTTSSKKQSPDKNTVTKENTSQKSDTDIAIQDLQISYSTEKLILKQPDSPLKVTVDEDNSTYSIQNNTEKKVNGFRLGCVLEDKGDIDITHNGLFLMKDIPAMDVSQNLVYARSLTIAQDESFSPCIKSKSKLAVLEVLFSDKTSWKSPF
jgi:hypothetical protein